MVFSDSIFLFLFFPCVLVGYYFLYLFKNIFLQNIFLLAVSLFFYTWGNPQFVIVMVLSIAINYIGGLVVDTVRSSRRKKFTVVFIVFTNLAILYHYKYQDFVMQNLNSILKTDFDIQNIVLPIGISFFTFQALSYVVDVYRGECKVQKNPLYLGLYISFFPQLIAGPIVRYETIEEQITGRKSNIEDFCAGVIRFAEGLVKKVLLSNNLAVAADFVFNNLNNGEYCESVATVWIGALAYTLQIYFDFSGYSDMAIGLGKMFGFKFEENFNYPYIASSITDFWRRWHISLSSWFRDYVYIPLGGNRCATFKAVFNLGVVWFLTGIWHGANWTFIIWGIIYFVFLVLEKYLIKPKRFQDIKLKIVYRIFTLIVIVTAWVLFRATDLKQAVTYIGIMFGVKAKSFVDVNTPMLINEFGVFIILGILFSMPIKNKLEQSKVIEGIKNFILVILMFASFVYIVNGTYNPFIYFNF